MKKKESELKINHETLAENRNILTTDNKNKDFVLYLDKPVMLHDKADKNSNYNTPNSQLKVTPGFVKKE